MLRKKGQSTLEYVLVLTAIIAAVVVVASQLQKKTSSTLEGVVNATGGAVDRLSKNITDGL